MYVCIDIDAGRSRWGDRYKCLEVIEIRVGVCVCVCVSVSKCAYRCAGSCSHNRSLAEVAAIPEWIDSSRIERATRRRIVIAMVQLAVVVIAPVRWRREEVLGLVLGIIVVLLLLLVLLLIADESAPLLLVLIFRTRVVRGVFVGVVRLREIRRGHLEEIRCRYR